MPVPIAEWFENPGWTHERLIQPPPNRWVKWESCGCGETRFPGAKQCSICHRLAFRERWERFIALWHQGCSYLEIAEELEMSYGAVRQLRLALTYRGYDLPPRRSRRMRG